MSGTFDSRGHNLIGNTGDSHGFGAPGDLLNVQPLLGPLQNNGGPTETLALLPGSPAIDAGDNDAITSATDQRGFPRFVNGVVDIGAYEFQQTATVTLTSSLDPSLPGQEVTFEATLHLVPQSNTPTGTMTFFDGDTELGQVAVDGSTVDFSTALLGTGNHQITAVYGGDVNFPPATSPALTQTVARGSTTTTVSASPDSSVFGQPVTFTAVVRAVATDLGTPTGTVTFAAGTTVLGTGTLDASGQAAFSTFALGVGPHTITASYSGDGNFSPSAADTGENVRLMVQPASTITVVKAVPVSSVFGQPITFTATVSPVAPGSGMPTGTVTFAEGTTVLGSGTLNASGQAAFSTSALGVGPHTITASYSGDGNFSPSSAETGESVRLVVQPASTITIVKAVPVSSVFGQPITFTATVSPVAPGSGVPTGTVTFVEGTTVLGSGTLDASGQASFSTSSLAVGRHVVTALYNGDDNFSVSVAVAVTAPTVEVIPVPTANNLVAFVPPPAPATPPAVGLAEPLLVVNATTTVNNIGVVILSVPGRAETNVDLITPNFFPNVAPASSSASLTPLPEDSSPPTRFQSSTQLTPLLSPSPDSQLVPSQASMEKRQPPPPDDSNAPGNDSQRKKGTSSPGPSTPKPGGQSRLLHPTGREITRGLLLDRQAVDAVWEAEQPSGPRRGSAPAPDEAPLDAAWLLAPLAVGLLIGEARQDR